MKIIIKHIKPENVARLLDVIRLNLVPDSEMVPSNWYTLVEVQKDDKDDND